MNSTLPASTNDNSSSFVQEHYDFMVGFMSMWLPCVVCVIYIKVKKECKRSRSRRQVSVEVNCPLPPPVHVVPNALAKKFAKVYPIDKFDIRVPDIPFYVVSPGNTTQVGVWKLENNRSYSENV